MKSIKFLLFSLLSIIIISGLGSCKKDARVKPSISFNTATGYVFKDTSLPLNTSFKIGIIAKKTEDELKSYNSSVTINGGTPKNNNTTLASSQEDGFNKDESYTSGTSAQTEKYEYTVIDKDGNISSISLTVTVK